MGFNTVALFLNDQSDALDKCGGEVLDTLRTCMRGGYGTDQFGGPGQMQVLPSAHADGLQVIIAGGNTIRLMGIARGYRSDDEEVLRQMADKLGFRLVRKMSRS